jgi:ATP-dependent Lhr-like helicase
MTAPFDLLHPVVQHHVVNTLEWSDLRPLQREAVAPVLAGVDCLLLAPTAGGKTEAAVLPLLSRMAVERWTGTSVLYVCPLRALRNNLQPRLDGYAGWLGRSARYWHGDVGQAARRQTLLMRPDILLTTPESLESILISTTVDSRRFLTDVRAVVVDEVHAFAGDDRGWHLLHVLERIAEIADQAVQRIGLSATVGNPDELVAWLQGAATDRPRRVIAPAGHTPSSDVQLDHVGSVENAATVVGRLHRGEKRLVFVDSRRRAEELGSALRARDVDTYLSHSSLSAAERRRSEQAFAEARDCVIVATSTLELGIDVGDLDRVIQIGAPRTVASFLQRIGRTGRRAGSSRNCLFLALDHAQTLQAAGLLVRWAEGWSSPLSRQLHLDTSWPSSSWRSPCRSTASACGRGRTGGTAWDRWHPTAKRCLTSSSPRVSRHRRRSGVHRAIRREALRSSSLPRPHGGVHRSPRVHGNSRTRGGRFGRRRRPARRHGWRAPRAASRRPGVAGDAC